MRFFVIQVATRLVLLAGQAHSRMMYHALLSPHARVHGDDVIIIVAEEEEQATVKISNEVESPSCTKNTI